MLHTSSPAAALAVDDLLAKAVQRTAQRQQALNSRSVFTDAQNAVRARAIARVELHKGLSQASLMLARNPAKALERTLPEGAALAAMQSLADNLAKAAPRRRSTMNGGGAPKPGTPSMPTSRALVGGSAHHTFLRRTMTANAQQLCTASSTTQSASHRGSLLTTPSGLAASKRQRPKHRYAVDAAALAQRQRERVGQYEDAVIAKLSQAPACNGAHAPHGRSLAQALAAMHQDVLAEVRQAQLVSAACQDEACPSAAATAASSNKVRRPGA